MSDMRENQQGNLRRYRIAGAAGKASSLTGALSTHVDDLAAGYALGALDPDETALVESHIRGCAECERAVRDAAGTTSMLPFLIPMQTPPIDAKVALFSRVAHAQRAAAAAALPTHNLDAFRTPTLPSSSGSPFAGPIVAALADAVTAPVRSARSGWLATALSMPLLVALIVTGFWGMQLRDQLSAQQSQLTQVQADLTNFGSGTTSYPLSPGGAAPQAEGNIIMGSDGRGGMLRIDVNSDEGPMAYELWANQGDQLVHVADVTVDQYGQGLTKFKLDQPFAEYESVHVKAKAIDSGAASAQYDTLMRDNNGSLGSTGSGLDIVP